MGIERAIDLLGWKGRSLFWQGKVDRFFYESRDRSILSQLFHSTIKLCCLIFYPIASIASGHPFNSPPLMSLSGVGF
ncbi:hypothetical protein [Microcoleus sp. B7-D4]|uniref:hypothetical protein n=1 Tax=Microcoleus sp. B7-D4 TaxID=2818696 RepID=UPI002FD23849